MWVGLRFAGLVLILLAHGRDALLNQPPRPPGFGLPALPNWAGGEVPWSAFNSTVRAFKMSFGRQQQRQQQQQLQRQPQEFSMQSWWESHTKGSRGILIWLMPALLSQLAIMRTVVPFFTDRLSQYLQPMAIAMFVGLLPGKGLRMLQNVLLTSAGIGACFMFRDTYCAGSSWLPLEAKEDSYAVVTGATSGLGRAFAELLYSRGFNLVLIASRDQQLRAVKRKLLEGAGESVLESDERLTEGILQTHVSGDSDLKVVASAEQSVSKKIDSPKRRDIILVSIDLGDPEAPNAVLRELRRRKVDDKIDVLINNAEVGCRGALIDVPLSSLTRISDLNVRATVGLTRVLAPRMIKRDSGARILIVGNIASAGPGPDVAVYTASKAFIASFASSLRRELLPQGVLVTLALAGPMLTNDRAIPSSFARSSGTADAFVFKLPGMSITTADAAEAIYKGMRLGRDVVCPSLAHRFHVHVLSRILPSAATGALARIAWQPPARWIPLIGGKRSTRVVPKKSAHESEVGITTDSGEVTGKGVQGLEKKLRRWFKRFWYSPIIDYSAIKKWLAYPFRQKGLDVNLDEDGLSFRRKRQIEDDDEAFEGGFDDWEKEQEGGEGEEEEEVGGDEKITDEGGAEGEQDAGGELVDEPQEVSPEEGDESSEGGGDEEQQQVASRSFQFSIHQG